MKMRSTFRLGAAAAQAGALVLAGLIGQAQAQVVFNGAVSTDIADPANWVGGVFPTTGDWAQIDTIGDLATTPPNNIRAIRLGWDAGSTGVLNIESNASWSVTTHTSWDSHIGTSGNGTLNINGGTLSLNFFEVGRNPGSLGIVNVNSGTLVGSRGSRKAGYSVHIGANDNSGNAGVGIVEISGGEFRCRAGLELGSSNGTGTGTFSVVGSGATQIGIGSQGSVNGKWDQYPGSTLKIAIDTNGVTPIIVDDVSGGLGAPVVFVADSLLDVSFLGGHVETNFWPVMIAEGAMANGGMKFAPGVDTNNWGFIVSNDYPIVGNNTLMVGYGLGWPAGGTPDKTPPPPGRSLYWTGAAGDADPIKETNWVVDTAGTPAEWGLYPNNDDVIYIGHADVTTNDFISQMDYADESGSGNNQGVLNLGFGRTGILNIVSGALAFPRNGSISTLGQQVGGVPGDATINLTGGTLQFNALRMGLGGSPSTLNIDGGDLTIGRAWNGASIYVGYGSTGTSTGTLSITSGQLLTRGEVRLGFLGDPGVFCVEGTNATRIGIGAHSSVDGLWSQGAGSVLKIRIGEGHGVTPIEVVEMDANNQNNGNVIFDAGSILDVGWMDGVNNVGSFDVMIFDGALTNNGLRLADTVDRNTWSFEFVDTDGDTSNDTLRVTAIDPLLITGLEIVGEEVTMAWGDTAPGAEYTLEATPDMQADDWAGVPPFINMVATGTSMSVTVPLAEVAGIPGAYRVKRELPASFLEDDFEGTNIVWTAEGTGSVWERGTPNVDNAFVVITNAASPFNAYATDTNATYQAGTDVTLTSPPIVIGTSTVVVEWAEAYDIEDDLATVSVIDEDAGTTTVVATTPTGTLGLWTPRLAELPLTPTGQTIRVVFRFQEVGNHDGGYAGWFIDDVVVREKE